MKILDTFLPIHIAGFVLAACAALSALEETQISPEEGRIRLDISFLDRLKHFRTVFQSSDGTSKFESARWAAADGRVEVIYGETAPPRKFDWFDLKEELRGYRYFTGSDITLTWRDSAIVKSPVGPIGVQLVNATYDGTLAKCAGFLVIWQERCRRLSGFFCDMTGPEMTAERIRELLSALSINGVMNTFAE